MFSDVSEVNSEFLCAWFFMYVFVAVFLKQKIVLTFQSDSKPFFPVKSGVQDLKRNSGQLYEPMEPMEPYTGRCPSETGQRVMLQR